MAWVTLALRKQSLKADINQVTMQITSYGREVRQIHRHLSHDQSIYNADKTRELQNAKSQYLSMRNSRPSVDSEEYKQWSIDFADAKEDYQAKKQDIEDYYDGICEELEQEANDEESAIEEQKTIAEAQREALNAELESISEAVSTEIKNSAIKF